MTLRLVSAGAAQALVMAVARALKVEATGSFGAVGAMLEKLDAGEAADVVILTRAQIDALAKQRRVLADTVGDLGTVATSIAVLATDAAPDVSGEDCLRAALLAADAIYFPDPARATAGIHFAKVLQGLGIAASVASKVRNFPNGATSMREMAAAPGHPIGCTQATEILATPGIRLVAALPRGCDLETTYTAAVDAHAPDPGAAREFVARLTSVEGRAQRRALGFG
jgi:molybdate transport system substrate-binding protein